MVRAARYDRASDDHLSGGPGHSTYEPSGGARWYASVFGRYVPTSARNNGLLTPTCFATRAARRGAGAPSQPRPRWTTRVAHSEDSGQTGESAGRLHHHGHALAAADRDRGQPVAADVFPHELREEAYDEHRPRRTPRVPEGEGTTLRAHLFRVE